ncbi:MAG TPA: pilus assembly protein PilM [Candidatus Paceibacterota bacterium]|nr:pilus assembly protein PilM [Candidatus Paceibacterota bacterium]
MMFTRTLARWFPVPRTLSPLASGVDISDTSIKWLTLAPAADGSRIVNYGSHDIGPDIVQTGAIRNADALADALKEVKKQGRVVAAHAALPEEGAYVFSMHVHPGSSRAQITSMIEFELEGRVPIPPKQAVYDFDFVGARGDAGEEIAVTVFPRELAEGYIEAFSKSGIELVSLEIEARSIGRAVSPAEHNPVTLLVDCGKARTGVAILKNGIPIFTSTVDIGGDHMSRALMEALSISEEDALQFKNEHGLVPDDPKLQKGFEAVDKVASGLAEEIARHYRFWDTHRTKSAQNSGVERVFLVGGNVNLKGFPEYIAGKVHAFTERPNVWCNVFSFDDYIPSIPYRASFQYATAIGLALRSVASV